MSESLDRLEAALIGRYAIEREIGRGGMATVYLARDLKHERDVAVKVFRPELAAAVGIERFLGEIRITARLSHPHILPLIDSGEAGSLLFYVVPYVEGATLREKLDRETELGIEESVRIAGQVASALAYAHSKGIIHRDIKPENILLQMGQVVVSDFGIALALDSAGGRRLTETGLSLGTPAYMSPEQVAGDEDIDARSDIYSLACVLYEMLAGDPPFTASHPRAILAKHLTEPPPSLATVRPGVSAPLQAAVAKALRKSPADRFDSAVRFAEALLAEEVVAEPETASIVVLPFENLSPDPDNAFFADGLTEELIAELSGVQALRVISRTSAMKFKDSKKGIPAIAKELTVRYALEGSVRRAGDSVRITAQLIDASADSHLWAERYTGRLDDVFDLQERMARRIVQALRVALTPEEDRQLAERPQVSGAAYECYLRARHEVSLWTESALDRAVQNLQAALEIEGDNAFLLASLAQVHAAYIGGGFRVDEATPRASKEYAQRAIALDPAVAPAHAALGELAFMTGDPKQAFVHLQRAVSLGTEDPNDLYWYVNAAGVVGKTSMSRPPVQRLAHADPLNSMAHVCRAALEYFEGRYDTAVDAVRTAMHLDPSSIMALTYGVFLLGAAGYLVEARATLDRWRTETPDHPFMLAVSTLLDALEGRHVESRALLAEVLADPEVRGSMRADPLGVLWGADIFTLNGETETALEWLEHGVGLGLINYPLLSEKEKLLEGLRGEPGFRSLMDRVKKEWEEFQVQVVG